MNKKLTLIALICFALLIFSGCGEDNTNPGGNSNETGTGTGTGTGTESGNECKGAGCALCSGASCAVECDRTFGEGCKACTASTCDSFVNMVYSCTGNDCSIKCADAACSSVKCDGKDCPIINCRTAGCELCSGASCTAGCFEKECNVCNENTPGNFLGCEANWGTLYSCNGNDCSIKCDNTSCSTVKCEGKDCPVQSCATAGCTLCSGSSCLVGCEERGKLCELCPSDNEWTCGQFGEKYGCNGEDCAIKCINAGCSNISCEGVDCPWELIY